MIYARVQVASLLDGSGKPHSGYHPTTESERSILIKGRLSVLDDSVKIQAFDTVRLSFRGVIASCIGKKSMLEDVITLTDIKTINDFRTNSNHDQTDAPKARHLEFFFHVPTTITSASGQRRVIPLTTTVSGNTNVTNHTALNDRQLIKGNVEVSYWIEAQFRQAGREVGHLHETVQLRYQHRRLCASLTNGSPLTMRAKHGLFSRYKLQKAPALNVSIDEADIVLERGPDAGQCRITIPLAVTMEGDLAPSLDARQSLKCGVEAKWEIHNRFSTATRRPLGGVRPTAGEIIYKTTTASTHKADILFRPLPRYESRSPSANTNTNSYAAAAQLDIDVPDSITQPSTRWEHYSRTYSLDLSLSFNGIQGAPRYTVRSSVPITISALTRTCDINKDGVVVNMIETVSDESIQEELDALMLDGATTTPGVERRMVTPTRTPPPTYFR
ncbi:hypothetical protein PV10_00407 [Exophiala mesophila]|uniref:Arrestin-like N-terminal domain-containing protein n=1 Tax=Exophiala mesophila TaxID=212818 RepID=A0A0D2ACB1_EXOME|nr:uncharacterized protein PV10_00407 [Exophiala mesophila]KIV96558.1 hypothetical protein PV10_00407 [Exophiala mesophila]